MFWRRKKDYIICASHRSGSTLLCEGVRWTWRCGDPKEYLSPTRSVAMFEKGEIATDPEADFPGYVHEVFETKRMENGVFGMKIMWKHLQKFPQRMEIPCAMRDHRRLARVLRSSFGPARYIWSRREDKVRQAISFLKAKQTRLFTHQQRALGGHLDETALEFDFDAISALVTRLEREEEEWKTFFDLSGITPLIVTYEDFAPDYEGTIKGCLKHIGVYEESLEIAAPNRNQKLADPVSETWVRLFGEEKAKREAAS